MRVKVKLFLTADEINKAVDQLTPPFEWPAARESADDQTFVVDAEQTVGLSAWCMKEVE